MYQKKKKKLGFERINAKFFRIVDENALIQFVELPFELEYQNVT